jgi:general secretion pathway protein K
MALLLVLWGIAITGITVMGLIQLTQMGMRDITDMERYERALYLAQSGINIATHAEVQPSDPLLKGRWNESETYEVVIRGEEGRFPVHTLLKEEYRPIWQRLFQQWNLSATEADTVLDCLLDWTQPGNGKRLNGATRGDYIRAGLPYEPTGKPFTSLAEMSQVLQFSLLSRKKPDWEEIFTLRGNGRIDVNECPADLLVAVLHVAPSQARSLIEYRKGPDGIAGTDDDVRFESLQQVQKFLGISDENFSRVSPLLQVQSSVLRIQSYGQAYGKTVQISAAVQRANARPPVIYEWNIR